MVPFMNRVNCLKAAEPLRRCSLLLTTKSPGVDQTPKDEKLCQLLSQLVVLYPKPVNWYSTALTTRPLLHVTKSKNYILPMNLAIMVFSTAICLPHGQFLVNVKGTPSVT